MRGPQFEVRQIRFPKRKVLAEWPNLERRYAAKHRCELCDLFSNSSRVASSTRDLSMTLAFEVVFLLNL